MVKHISQVSYRFGDDRVEPMAYFLYEVSIYLDTKNMSTLLEVRYFKSDKLLEIKKDVVSKKLRSSRITRYINLVGAPIEFIQENHLPIFELIKPFKKKKK